MRYHGVKLYQIARKINRGESTMYKDMRDDLSDEKFDKAMRAAEEIVAERETTI